MTEVKTSALGGGPSIVRLALTGAAVFSILFAVYWMRAALAASLGPHAFLPIFSPAAELTSAAFALGFFLAILFGALAGALSALFYNLFARRG